MERNKMIPVHNIAGSGDFDGKAENKKLPSVLYQIKKQAGIHLEHRLLPLLPHTQHMLQKEGEYIGMDVIFDITFLFIHSTKLYLIHFSRTPNEESPFTYWNISIKLLAAMVIFGIGWIVGFVVRWGVHHYYIDPKGHCITPRLYR